MVLTPTSQSRAEEGCLSSQSRAEEGKYSLIDLLQFIWHCIRDISAGIGIECIRRVFECYDRDSNEEFLPPTDAHDISDSDDDDEERIMPEATNQQGDSAVVENII
ncbi:hypothetical protein NPIL_581131 [Nephila pilipes]|uniref:Uncharacterized protein n=1 Tax=Nephila pilipes TaxID=299642 RepID=A0A8X6TW14_NEPPI|nr:hypothetical protein NPIL_581131 [Nephila pilipes]